MTHDGGLLLAPAVYLSIHFGPLSFGTSAQCLHPVAIEKQSMSPVQISTLFFLFPICSLTDHWYYPSAIVLQFLIRFLIADLTVCYLCVSSSLGEQRPGILLPFVSSHPLSQSLPLSYPVASCQCSSALDTVEDTTFDPKHNGRRGEDRQVSGHKKAFGSSTTWACRLA